MDIEMGLMDGMEAAEQIRKVDEQVIIYFLSPIWRSMHYGDIR